MRLVIALGGNALLRRGEAMTAENQRDNVRIAAPKALWPLDELVEQCKAFAAESGARITLTEDPKEAVKGVDFIHTDVWVSMGEPVEAWADRIKLLLPYQVNAEMMKASGTPRTQFMHCLPAFHNTDTKVGKQLVAQYPFLANGVEVTEEVFESPACIAFDQAENRMHTIKAVMVATLGNV